jgi:hypothetical protein
MRRNHRLASIGIGGWFASEYAIAYSDDFSHRFRSKPAGDSDDPSRPPRRPCQTALNISTPFHNPQQFDWKEQLAALGILHQ